MQLLFPVVLLRERGSHWSREDLRFGGVNAQTDGHSIAFNPFQSFLYDFEAVTKQSNAVGIGEARDRYGGAHLHTKSVTMFQIVRSRISKSKETASL